MQGSLRRNRGSNGSFIFLTLKWNINAYRKRWHFRKLTVNIRFTRDNWVFHLFADLLEKLPTRFQILRSLGLCLFENALAIPKSGLQPHRTSQDVWVVDHVQLGAFDVSLCVVELAFPSKQLRQGVVNPERMIAQIEKGCNFEGYLEMVGGLLLVVLETIYVAKNSVAPADLKLLAFLWEINRTACGVGLSVVIQRPSEVDQTPRLFCRITKPFRILDASLACCIPFSWNYISQFALDRPPMFEQPDSRPPALSRVLGCG